MDASSEYDRMWEFFTLRPIIALKVLQICAGDYKHHSWMVGKITRPGINKYYDRANWDMICSVFQLDPAINGSLCRRDITKLRDILGWFDYEYINNQYYEIRFDSQCFEISKDNYYCTNHFDEICQTINRLSLPVRGLPELVLPFLLITDVK